MKRILISVLLVALALGLMAFQSAPLPQGVQSDNPCSSIVTVGIQVPAQNGYITFDL